MADLKEIALQDRQNAMNRGGALNAEAAKTGWEQQWYQNYYRELGDKANELLMQGYSQDEIQGILGTDALQALAYTQQEGNANYLTPQEQAGVTGDPNAAMKYVGEAEGNQDVAGKMQRGVTSSMQGALDNSIGTGLYLDPNYKGEQADVINQGDTAVAGTLEDTAGRTRAAIDPAKLEQDQAAAAKIRMTPEQQQDIITSAGLSATVGHQAAVDAAERSARAAGADPLGVAAYRAREERGAASDSADALTKARVAANAEAASREMGLEQNRQASEQYLSGAEVGNERSLGAATTAAQQDSINRRVGVQQEAEQARLKAEEDVANRKMQAATTGGEAAIDTEKAIAGQQLATSQFGANTQQTAEQAAAARAAELAKNRQATTMTNSATQYTRGKDLADTAATRAKQVADTRIGTTGSGRDYYTSQNAQANTNANNAANRQVSIYGTQGQLEQGGTKEALAANSQPGFWDKFLGAAMGAGNAAATAIAGAKEGTVVDKPTYLDIGEDGPEAVVPVGDEPKKRSAFARYGLDALKGFGKGGIMGAASEVGGDYLNSRRMHNEQPMQPGQDPEIADYINDAVSYKPMAAGSVVDRPTRALIGENGPEAVVPLSGRQDARVRPSDVGMGALPGSRYGSPSSMTPMPQATATPAPAGVAGYTTQPFKMDQPQMDSQPAATPWSFQMQPARQLPPRGPRPPVTPPTRLDQIPPRGPRPVPIQPPTRLDQIPPRGPRQVPPMRQPAPRGTRQIYQGE